MVYSTDPRSAEAAEVLPFVLAENSGGGRLWLLSCVGVGLSAMGCSAGAVLRRGLWGCAVVRRGDYWDFLINLCFL